MYFDGFLRQEMKNENYGQGGTAHLNGCCVCVCCVLCFVLSPKQSGVLKCHLSEYQKIKIMSYVFRRVSSLRPEKKKFQSSVWRKKKDTVVYVFQRVSSLRLEKKKVPVVCLVKKKRCSRLCISTVFFVTTGKKKFQSSVW